MGRVRRGSTLVLLVLAALACAPAPPPTPDPRACCRGVRFEVPFRELRRFDAPAARQGVAVDADHFYAIGTRRIEKYARADGRRVAVWEAGGDSRIVHLNGGVVVDGELWCAHSNYPGVPMESHVVRFDATDLSLVEIEPLPWAPGSLTWFDRRGETWWFAFAHYAGRGGVPGKGPESSRLVSLDADGQPARSLRFPPEALSRFGRYSASGGAFSAGGRLAVTGHDAAELYWLRIPETGDTLRWEGAVPLAIAGQGIAFGPQRRQLWGIHRARRQVVHFSGVAGFSER